MVEQAASSGSARAIQAPRGKVMPCLKVESVRKAYIDEGGLISNASFVGGATHLREMRGGEAPCPSEPRPNHGNLVAGQERGKLARVEQEAEPVGRPGIR